MVSSHYGYKEEYVLEHTPSWLNRKFEQAVKEKWDNHKQSVMEGFKSLMLLVDSAFNKGKGINDILPDSYEDIVKQKKEQTEQSGQFIENQWWKSEG